MFLYKYLTIYKEKTCYVKHQPNTTGIFKEERYATPSFLLPLFLLSADTS